MLLWQLISTADIFGERNIDVVSISKSRPRYRRFDCLLVGLPFQNLSNSVARDEQTTTETHRFPWEGQGNFCSNFREERLTDVN